MNVIEKQKFDVEKVRKDFPILSEPLSKNRKLVYLDNGASAQKPSCVIQKETEVYEKYYANAYRGVYEFGAKVDEELEASRTAVAELIHAESSDLVAFTSGTTMSINIVAMGWGGKFLQEGDEILLNEMEHHANIVPWQQVAKQTGAKIVYLPMTEDLQLDIENLDQYLTSKTKIVAVTAMSNVLGTINPIEVLTKRAHDVGAVILVDAAQSVPHMPVDVSEVDVDFMTFSGHKVFGPTGIGVLYGKRNRLEEMDPYLFGGHMIEQVHHDHSTWAHIPAKFEAGTIPIAQAIGLGTAIDYLQSFDLHEVEAYEKELLQYAMQRVDNVPGMTVHGPAAEIKGPIVSFTIQGAHPEDLAQLLNRKGVFVRHGHHCAMLLHQKLGITASVRASFALYNTKEEVDALFEAIKFAMQRLRLI